MMRKTRVPYAAFILLVATVASTRINFKNQCPHQIDLYDNVQLIPILPSFLVTQNVSLPSLMWRHGYDPQATRTVDLRVYCIPAATNML